MTSLALPYLTPYPYSTPVCGADTVQALSEAVGMPIGPRRFRPNLVLSGNLPAWAEFDWVGRRLAVGVRSSRSSNARCAVLSLFRDGGRFHLGQQVP